MMRVRAFRTIARILVGSALAALGLFPSGALAQSSYTFTDIGTLAGGLGQGWGVNNSGHVAGTSGSNAFYYGGAGIVDLGAGEALGINDSDWVVGDSGGRAVVWRPNGGGGFTQSDLTNDFALILPVGYALISARKITNGNVVIGQYYSPATGISGFVLDMNGPAFSDLGKYGGWSVYPYGINSSGLVCGGIPHGNLGFWSAPPYTSGVTVTGLTAVDVNDQGALVGSYGGVAYYSSSLANLPGMPIAGGLGNYSGANGITNAASPYANTVVGAYRKTPTAGSATAFRWTVGARSVTTLISLAKNAKGWNLINALDISDAGYIVGQDWDGKTNGKQHAYLLTPNP